MQVTLSPEPLTVGARYVGAIDQGTSSTRFILFDAAGRIVRTAQKELHQIHVDDQPGWAEHDPVEIMRTIEECFASVLDAQPTIAPDQIVAVGITNQRETTVMWDAETGRPFHNALVWHDTRTSDLVDQLTQRYADRGGKDVFRPQCGLPLSTYFSALKMRWLIDHVPTIHEALAVDHGKRVKVGTIDSWIIWNLTRGTAGAATTRPVHVTDVTNASRTMLMNLATRQWDADVCREFGIPLAILPEIRSSAEVYGTIASGLLAGIPISGCLGDQQAAMVGQLCFAEGTAKNTYGTGCFMLLNTGTRPVASRHGLLTTVCYQLGPREPCYYALEGSVAVAGSGVRWLRDQLKLISSAADIERLALTVPHANDCYFVPAFSGLLSPYWRDDARGIIAGLTHSSNSGHLARAVLDAAAYQTREVLDAMQADTNGRVPLTSLRVDGGMAASDLLMQFQSDLLAIPVVRPRTLEATASGAAYCAGLAVGFWSSRTELESRMAQTRTADGVQEFAPRMPVDRREQLFFGWRKAVQRTFGWAETPREKQIRLNSPTPYATSSPFNATIASPPAHPVPHQQLPNYPTSAAAAAAAAAATHALASSVSNAASSSCSSSLGRLASSDVSRRWMCHGRVASSLVLGATFGAGLLLGLTLARTSDGIAHNKRTPPQA